MATRTATKTTTPAKAARPAKLPKLAELAADGRDPRVEAFIGKFGITKFDYEVDVPPSAFDLEECLANQARITEPIDEELAEQYAEDLRNGDVFPPIIAFRRAGSLRTVDGNHRLVAAKRASKKLRVYVVEASDPVLVLMTFEANVRHGKKSPPEDRIQQAMWLIANQVAVGEIARRLSLTASQINRASSIKKADDNAEDAGISEAAWWKALKQGVKIPLGRLNSNPALVAAAQLAANARLSPDEATKLVGELNGLRSDELRLQYIKAKTSELADAVQGTGGGAIGSAGNRRVLSPVGELRSVIRVAQKLPPDGGIVSGVGQAEKAALAESCRQVARRFLDVAEALAPER